MKLVFVDTYAIHTAQGRELIEPLLPIIVYDMDGGEHERTGNVEIVGPARMKFEMAPDHNLARVWVEAESDSLVYDGVPVQWNAGEKK